MGGRKGKVEERGKGQGERRVMQEGMEKTGKEGELLRYTEGKTRKTRGETRERSEGKIMPEKMERTGKEVERGREGEKMYGSED